MWLFGNCRSDYGNVPTYAKVSFRFLFPTTMLPSRLFRNVGVPPALRSLISPSPNLPSNIAVQLRFRLGVRSGSVPGLKVQSERTALFCTSASARSAQSDKPAVQEDEQKNMDVKVDLGKDAGGDAVNGAALPGRIEPRLALEMTCTVSGCGERSRHEFTKQAYEKGIVLVQCPKCNSRLVVFVFRFFLGSNCCRHLIADHLGWFKELTDNGKNPTLEELMKAKGEKIRTNLDAGSSISITGDS